MLQHAQENRSNAMRHLEEASEFLSRIEAKKEEEIQKWREKLKCIKEREALLDYYRQNRKYDQKAGMYRRRHSKSRKSAWDVDKVLLNQLMESFTEEERHELEKLQNKEVILSHSLLILKFKCFVFTNCWRRKQKSILNGDT